MVVGDQLSAINLYYEPPSAVLGRYSEGERVEWMLAQLTRLRATEGSGPACTRISLTENLEGARLASGIETAFFRVAQEALTKVRKHAHSHRVAVHLTRAGTRLRLEVRDWGVGFESDDQDRVSGRTGVGLMSMQERIALLGGEWSVESRTGIGTTIRAEVELPVS